MTILLFTLIFVAFAVSWMVTLAMKHISPRIGFVDKPGHRKIHHNPKPLGGGVGIMAGFLLPVAAGLVIVWLMTPRSLPPDAPAEFVERAQTLNAYVGGAREQTPLVLSILGGALVLHLMGLRDDREALGPYAKLFIQLAVTTAIVVAFPDLRILTALGSVLAIVATVLWITAITNAFNFLDNMDGLSAGVAAVCTTAFLVATLSIQQWFVAAALALLLGALLGFLCFNFSPATIFMGDAGSLVVGFLLGVLTVRTTFLPPGADFGAGWYAVVAPLIVLAVPLYDLVVVSIIRLRNGKSPFVGDTNHFSHRLVARGMSRRTAVLCIYLVTAATSAAAIVLPHVRSGFLAAMIVGQTVLILGVVALLEQHPLPVPKEES
ncbi:MAG TPA: MraY family glycosyltransferase [Tepidisphaeraceae bacterium]|jgi:UDP-GlcNAc:undecaprenyl-phosphate GlcNAc-1-phosphate transferase|nr:MraY family glycosyltransferase [Tepidisphaeraceae bacterium]